MDGTDCAIVSRADYTGNPAVAQCVKCGTVYEATGWQPRICQACNVPYGDSLIDPCLGYIEGVDEACCGHGDPKRRYFSWRS